MSGHDVRDVFRAPSRLGLTLSGPAARSLASDAPRYATLAAGELRLAVSLGIDAIEIPADPSRAAIETAVGKILEGRPHEPFLTGFLPAERARWPPEAWSAELELSARRLGGRPYDLLWLRGGPPEVSPALHAVEKLRAEGRIRAWGWDLTTGPFDLERIDHGVAAGTRWFRLRYNLLEPSPGAEALDRISSRGAQAIVVDALGGGRLDGSWLGGGPGAPPPLRRPDELAREMAPVLGLGFLTEGRRRTLAQAALQFALRGPSVACVAVEFGAPERLREYLEALDRPTLSNEELARLGAMGQQPAPVPRERADHSRSSRSK